LEIKEKIAARKLALQAPNHFSTSVELSRREYEASASNYQSVSQTAIDYHVKRQKTGKLN